MYNLHRFRDTVQFSISTILILYSIKDYIIIENENQNKSHIYTVTNRERVIKIIYYRCLY